MNKIKSILLGCAAGAGVMFLALNYHVVHSHDGFRFVPRAPQVSLGLTFSDIRDWDQQQWIDRPEVARALVAHGSSDLITEAAGASIAETLRSESGSLDQLRSLLNGPFEEIEPPRFDMDSELNGGCDSGDDSLTIPIPREARRFRYGHSFTERSFGEWPPASFGNDDGDALFRSGLGGFEDVSAPQHGGGSESSYPPPPDHASPHGKASSDVSAPQRGGGSESSYPPPPDHASPHGKASSRDEPLSSRAAERRREMSGLEDLFFPEEDDDPNSVSDPDSIRFDSVRREFDLRTSRSLSHAQSVLRDESNSSDPVADAAIDRYDRGGVRTVRPSGPFDEYQKPPYPADSDRNWLSPLRNPERYDLRFD